MFWDTLLKLFEQLKKFKVTLATWATLATGHFCCLKRSRPHRTVGTQHRDSGLYSSDSSDCIEVTFGNVQRPTNKSRDLSGFPRLSAGREGNPDPVNPGLGSGPAKRRID